MADSLNMGQGILIEWKWSQSSDLVEQRIERRKEGSPSWTTLRSFDQDTIERYSEHDDLISLVGGIHIDTTAVMGLDYDYRVLAVDDAGNRSSSDIVTATPFDNGLRGQISNLTASLISDVHGNHRVKLEWEYDQPQGLYHFEIYRKVDKYPKYLLTATSGMNDPYELGTEQQAGASSYTYLDWELALELEKNQNVDRLFTYQVQAIHVDGGWSELSEEVSIIVR